MKQARLITSYCRPAYSFLLLSLTSFALFAERKPNVVFILADDLGWRDLSVEGSDFYESPHIDRIANEGMRFTQGYATCQVCSPSRASLMTGKYPARLDITNWIGAQEKEDWKRNTKLLLYLVTELEAKVLSDVCINGCHDSATHWRVLCFL